LRRALRGYVRGERAASRGQPRHPPRADHDPRGDDPRVLGTLPGADRMGGLAQGVSLLLAPRQPVRPMGRGHRAHAGGPRLVPRHLARQARGPGRRPGRLRDPRGQAQALPRARAARGVVRARRAGDHGVLPGAVTMASACGQLTVIGSSLVLLCGLTLLWRRGSAAHISAFALQSVAVATMAGLIAVLTGSRELWVVAVVFLGLKGILMPMLLKRME